MAVLHSSSVVLSVFAGAFTGGLMVMLCLHLSNFLTSRFTGTLSCREKLATGLFRVVVGTICDLGSVCRRDMGCGGVWVTGGLLGF